MGLGRDSPASEPLDGSWVCRYRTASFLANASRTRGSIVLSLSPRLFPWAAAYALEERGDFGELGGLNCTPTQVHCSGRSTRLGHPSSLILTRRQFCEVIEGFRAIKKVHATRHALSHRIRQHCPPPSLLPVAFDPDGPPPALRKAAWPTAPNWSSCFLEFEPSSKEALDKAIAPTWKSERPDGKCRKPQLPSTKAIPPASSRRTKRSNWLG